MRHTAERMDHRARRKEAAGSRWAAQCGACLAFAALLWEAQKGVTVGPKKERKKRLKPINIQKSRKNKYIDLNDQW